MNTTEINCENQPLNVNVSSISALSGNLGFSNHSDLDSVATTNGLTVERTTEISVTFVGKHPRQTGRLPHQLLRMEHPTPLLPSRGGVVVSTPPVGGVVVSTHTVSGVIVFSLMLI